MLMSNQLCKIISPQKINSKERNTNKILVILAHNCGPWAKCQVLDIGNWRNHNTTRVAAEQPAADLFNLIIESSTMEVTRGLGHWNGHQASPSLQCACRTYGHTTMKPPSSKQGYRADLLFHNQDPVPSLRQEPSFQHRGMSFPMEAQAEKSCRVDTASDTCLILSCPL